MKFPAFSLNQPRFWNDRKNLKLIHVQTIERELNIKQQTLLLKTTHDARSRTFSYTFKICLRNRDNDKVTQQPTASVA